MKRLPVFFLTCLFAVVSLAQENKPLRIELNDDGSNYVQFVGVGQIWFRSLQLNPGSEINGAARSANTDILLRRFRAVSYGKLTDKLAFFTVFGGNNISFTSSPYSKVGLLDFSADYTFADWLAIGAGKTSWHGLSRFSSTPSAISILSVDLPVFALPTVMINDDISRMLAVYAKGQVGGFDYRLSLARPFQPPNIPATERAQFDPNNNTFRTAGYFKYQFKDRESNLLPLGNGTYAGKKSIFNIGVGFDYHPDAMIRLENNEPLNEDMLHFAVDVFYDVPLNRELNTALSVYGGYFHYDYGKDYIRRVGIGNPTTEFDESSVTFNGPGNAYPMMGTGNILYTQAGYLLPNKWNNKVHKWQAQMTGAVQMAQFDVLKDPMIWYDLGFNILMDQYSKISFGYQGRPIFESENADSNDYVVTGYKGSMILQYQFVIR